MQQVHRAGIQRGAPRMCGIELLGLCGVAGGMLWLVADPGDVGVVECHGSLGLQDRTLSPGRSARERRGFLDLQVSYEVG